MQIGPERFVPALPPNVRRALESLKARLIAHFGAQFYQLRLFGSHARGEQHEESDVDVLILFETEQWGWDDEVLFREIAKVDVEERLWLSAMTLSKRKYEQMLTDETGIALAIEEEGIIV